MAIFNWFSDTSGAVSELVARWLSTNLLEVDVIFDHRAVEEDADSMTDSEKITEQVPEADSISLESSEELIILEGKAFFFRC